MSKQQLTPFYTAEKPRKVWGKVPAYVTTHPLLSDASVRLFAFMSSFISDFTKPVFWSGNVFCANGLGWSCPKKVRKAIKQLLNTGCISIHKKNRFGIIEYWVNYTPYECSHPVLPPEIALLRQMPTGNSALPDGQNCPSAGEKVPCNADLIADNKENNLPLTPSVVEQQKKPKSMKGGDFASQVTNQYFSLNPKTNLKEAELYKWVAAAAATAECEVLQAAILGAATDDFWAGADGTRRYTDSQAMRHILRDSELQIELAARYHERRHQQQQQHKQQHKQQQNKRAREELEAAHLAPRTLQDMAAFAAFRAQTRSHDPHTLAAATVALEKACS